MKQSIDGNQIHIATGGRAHQPDRPFIFFLHGSGQSHLTWVLQTRLLAYDGYNIVAPDFPAHGLSGGDALTSIEDMAAWVLRLADRLGVDNFILAGHSQGALVALELAARHPERIDRLVLIGCAAAIPVNDYLVSASKNKLDAAIKMMTGWGHGLRAHKHENSQPGFSHLGFGRQLMAANHTDALHVDLTACNNYSSGADAAANITMPTLVILAGADKMTPVKFGKKLADMIPDAELVIVDKAGHMLPAEHPDDVNTPLRAFLPH